MAHILGVSGRVGLMLCAGDAVSAEDERRALELCDRRADSEPLQYILGSWSFMGREYKVGEGVLIPRDDTEVVVSAALNALGSKPDPAILDLCSGSGVIAITLKLALPGAHVHAVEKSAGAFAYLRQNAEALGAAIKTIHADIADCADDFSDDSLDLLIANPPYIRTAEIASLQREIAYEPRLALDGGESGYDFYDRITALYTEKLREGGVIAYELGEEQFPYVSELLTRYGYTDIRAYPDIAGTLRAVTAKK